MNRNKTIFRVIAAVLALLMAATICMQLFSFWAMAAIIPAGRFITYDWISVKQGSSAVDRITIRKIYNIELELSWYYDESDPLPTDAKEVKFYTDTDYWSKQSDSKMTVKITPTVGSQYYYTVNVKITDLQYANLSQSSNLIITGIDNKKTPTAPEKTLGELGFPSEIAVKLPNYYFETTTGSGSSGDWEEETFESDIVIESVSARDKDGNAISEVTKDTPPFTIDVVYTDRGFPYYLIDEFTDDTLFAYLTDGGDFAPQGTQRGTLKRIATADADPPRFRATFQNMKFSGTAQNFGSFEFRTQYLIYGNDVSGTATARLYNVKADEEDEDEPAPPTPYIIIGRHNLGAEQIEAGSTFTLTLDFSNTSRDMDLENVMMVINPVSTEQQQSFLSIASSTNTYYYDRIPAGGGLSQAVDILVKSTASVGSQAVSVDFKYEYIVDKTRERGNTVTTLYIPITQIDRFTVDPITDYSSYMELGQEGYATVSFVNHGKSTTFNVSGYLVDEYGEQGQTEHFGNLEAGQNGTLDFTVIPQSIGEYNGQIIIRYEDENGEEKEVPVTFSAFVQEPWRPQPPGMEDGFPGMEMPEEPETPWWRYVLFAAGGLAIGAPMALYLAKRVTAKGKEDFDEDF